MTPHLCEDRGREEALLLGNSERLKEDAHENEDIVEPLAQRRHADGHYRETEVEVLAETAAIHLALEIAVGRADDANVHLARARLPDPADLARLERAQELRLKLDRQLADLVEEDGPAVGRLECPDAVAVGAGEAAANVTEKLALDEAWD